MQKTQIQAGKSGLIYRKTEHKLYIKLDELKSEWREEKGMKNEKNSSSSKVYHMIYQTRWRQYYDMGTYGCQWNGLTDASRCWQK